MSAFAWHDQISRALAPPAAAAHRWHGSLPAVLHTVTLRVRAWPSELVRGLLPQLCVQSVGPMGFRVRCFSLHAPTQQWCRALLLWGRSP